MHTIRIVMVTLLVLAMTSALCIAVALEPPETMGRWVLMDRAAGSNSCVARLAGSDIDTVLMLNQNGQLVLVAGRADWHGSGSHDIALRIDEFEIDDLQVSAFNNLVLVPISDETVLKRLKVAKDLYWSLPSGRYHAAVAGLGDALEWVHRCEEGKHLRVSGGL